MSVLASSLDHSSSDFTWEIVINDVNKKISQDHLVSLLEKCQISYRIILDDNEQVLPINEIPFLRQILSGKNILWSDRTVQVESFHVGSHYYLFTRLCEENNRMEVSREAILSLKRTIAKVSIAFESAFGSSHYTESVFEGEEGWAIQLFPSGNFGTSQPEEVDICAKAQRIFYILSQGRFGEASLSSHSIQKLVSFLGDVMGRFYLPDTRNQRSAVIKSQWIRNGEAAVSVAKTLLSFWEQSGLRVKRTQDSYEAEIPDIQTPIKETINCPFCNDEIVSRQLLIEGEHMRILYNHLPYIGREGEETRHFMIVSKHHLENSADASDAELIEEHEMLIRIRSLMLEKYKGFHHRIWKQQGIKAGQTVPHHHTHVLIYRDEELPEHLKQLGLEILGIATAPITQKSPQFTSLYLEKFEGVINC